MPKPPDFPDTPIGRFFKEKIGARTLKDFVTQLARHLDVPGVSDDSYRTRLRRLLDAPRPEQREDFLHALCVVLPADREELVSILSGNPYPPATKAKHAPRIRLILSTTISADLVFIRT